MALNAIIIFLAYLLGSIPSGLIVGKVFYGKDIREHGSGNLGGTNTFRTLGVKAGMAVSIADVLKGTLAASLPLLLDADIHTLLVGIFAVIGHMYPIFAGFRGGKAVATSGGVLLAYAPVLFLFMLIFFFISLYITKYVSLSSILTGIAAFIYSLFTRDLPLILVVAVLATFVIYRHRANIKRIRNKTEPKIKWL
ncbi:glycerol-3-phosphate 1-O-acyltransferase PlsY [Bacillus sp. ISL-35]|uniref:glycerol-3-phosphate 1-O-acyltransferase PlsY n=1 Tax=Bacillus sp. ISL-35 TaxID=2819122 RepID=UPI001BE98EEE|nr:glycerol-3-phosphate 1-O-acyltransferase PlsY [Bacillus sp. ISL-35]MBT2680848.1 glycerol-3-phosphate 1-O-acyltransferase PlsY [Bacillus sp. ISL-35]MBT2705164.1 glycerol-3-phosphate 1-O-acyltransferase PlsY [Chryseobacterium sp. ISL-80]